MINGFCKKNRLEKVCELLLEMGEVGFKFDSFIYNILILYFSNIGDLKMVYRIFRWMVNDNIFFMVVIYGVLIYVCCLVGEFDEVMKIF